MESGETEMFINVGMHVCIRALHKVENQKAEIFQQNNLNAKNG